LFKALTRNVGGVNTEKVANSYLDRWGRLLMRRHKVIISHRKNRKPRQLWETNHLLTPTATVIHTRLKNN